MEHGAFDMTALREFMRGLVAGGPTKSGHRTPAVIATLPILGLDEAGMRANSWVVQQVLACGVHGILLCHARSPESIRVMIEASRYPFAEKVAGLGEGFRGSGSQGYASEMWGIPATEYLKRADPWPLNKNGEILMGLKIEDKYALANAEKVDQGAGCRVCRVGSWRHGILPGRRTERRIRRTAISPGAATGARPDLQGRQRRENLLLERVQREGCRRDDQGRRHDLLQRPTGCRERPEVQQAADALVKSDSGCRARLVVVSGDSRFQGRGSKLPETRRKQACALQKTALECGSLLPPWFTRISGR